MQLVLKTKSPYFNKSINRSSFQTKVFCYRKDINIKTASIKAELKKAIEEAEEKCALIGNTTECVIAWEKVDEITTAFYKCVSQQVADTADPLEKYCEDVPEADECREYDV